MRRSRRRQERVYYPRRSRAPYFAHVTQATTTSTTTGDAAHFTSGSGNPTTLSSAWNEADAAAGGGGSMTSPNLANPNGAATSTTRTTTTTTLTSPALRGISSVPRMPRVTSEVWGQAAILPTARRSESNLLSIAAAASHADDTTAAAATLLRRANGTAFSAADQERLASRLAAAAATEPDWRLRVRMRTVGVGLVMALNIGTDPPDTIKPHPCAVMQCWMDPRTVSRSKAKEWIGERLEHQYAVWQLARTARPLRYRRALDPTVDDVRNLCIQLRRQARNE